MKVHESWSSPVGRAVALALVLTIASSRAGMAEPFVELLGETFYITRGTMDGSMGVAFDPLERKVLSVGLTDPCGSGLESPFADQGASWDPVDNVFWIINQQREVKVWDGDTQVPLFTLPEIFDVPGVGPDTLESVRGLALDEEFMYVVDAGSDFGEIESNAWFKFTRDGTPVSSSKATDFTANLDAAPDATVDGICWIPPDAPYGAGLFLVALEHSGFQVIDEDGFFVDELVWEDEGIPIGAVPFAFSGITMDPLTGDLYLVENSGSKMYVWVRLPEDETPVVYSIGAPQLRVHDPAGECSRETFFGTGDPGDIFFSLAYRPSDARFWTSDFNSGELFLLDPRSGLKESSGVQGPVNIWGMAYDEGTDALYLHASDDQQLWTYDFDTGMSTEAPSNIGFYTRDIAFRPSDGMLFSVETGDPYNLIQIDPSTGAGTAIGPTARVTGLDYDKYSGQLIGVDRTAKALVAIDPSDGSHAVIKDLSGEPFSSEALGIIPHGDATASVVSEGRAAVSIVLRTFPNPSSGEVEIRWDSAQDHDSAGSIRRVDVLDISGRVVRTLTQQGAVPIRWDGRNARGIPVSAGMYYVRAETGARRGNTAGVATGKVIIHR